MYNPFKDWAFYAMLAFIGVFIAGGLVFWDEEKIAFYWGLIVLAFATVCLIDFRAKQKKNLKK